MGLQYHAADYTIRKDGVWFGEAQSRVVVSVSPDKQAAFKKAMRNFPYEELGVVTENSVEVDGQEWGNISEWKLQYNTAIEKLLGVNANN